MHSMKHLPRMPKALGSTHSINKLDEVVHTSNPSTREVEVRRWKSKVILSYINSRSTTVFAT